MIGHHERKKICTVTGVFSITFLISRHLLVSLTHVQQYSSSQNSDGVEENHPAAADPDISTQVS